MQRLLAWMLFMVVISAWGCGAKEPDPPGIPTIPPGRGSVPASGESSPSPVPGK